MKKNDSLPVLDALPALSPEILAASAAEAVRDILEEAASANTTRSYTSALRYWGAWYRGRFGRALTIPALDAAIVQFIVDHVARRGNASLIWELPPALDSQLVAAGFKQRVGALKLSTVMHRVAVLSKVHRLKKAANPHHRPRHHRAVAD